MKSLFSSDNIGRLLHVTDAIRDCPTPCAILLVDAEKGFD